MNAKLSEIILLSDVDGTLVETPAPIPARNIEALERFTKAGGRFALATGRGIQSAARFIDQLPVNVPCILYNGAGLYDYASKTMLKGHYLPPHYVEYTKKVIAQFPEIGATAFFIDRMCSFANRHYVDLYLGDEKTPVVDCDIDFVPDEPCIKIIFISTPEFMAKVRAFMNAQGWSDVTLVSSSDFFYEMLPMNVSKLTGLHALAEHLNIPVANTVAIGDYYNDEKMLGGAGFSATVAAAPDDIKQLCQYVTCDCCDGALADLVEHLERICN